MGVENILLERCNESYDTITEKNTLFLKNAAKLNNFSMNFRGKGLLRITQNYLMCILKITKLFLKKKIFQNIF